MEVRFRRVRIPLLSPFTTSFGTQENREALLLFLSADGIEAYSECVADSEPYYSYEDNETALHIIGDILYAYIEDLPAPEVFLRRTAKVKGHNMAKAAVEMLLWDYHAKKNRKPLHSMLGESRGYAMAGISIGMSKIDSMLKSVEDALEKGYRRIKVKISRGREFEILKAIRDRFPDIPLSADANSDYTIKDIELLERLDRFNLLYIEQPLEHDDIVRHAELAKRISTPICLDESITDARKAELAFELGACKIVNIKPGRVSGLSTSLEIASIARKYGGHCWVGGMLETGIGRSFNIALASNALIDYPGDTSPNSRYFAKDIVSNPFEMNEGMIRCNEHPGCGAIVDREALEMYTLQSGLLLMR
jgi:O-succinylbenzoate synthase